MKHDKEIVEHLSPIMGSQADAVLHAPLPAGETPRRFEQLWAKQIGESTFVICCIPFIVKNISLGDTVSIWTEGELEYVVKEVVKSGGHFTYHVWFKDQSSH